MRIFYNGSHFAFDAAEPIYNPTLVFHFLREWQETCHYPEQILDGNLAPDYQKLVYVSQHPDGEEIILTAINDAETLSVTEVGERFGMREMLAPDKRWERMASLLCYLGVLTVAGRTGQGKFELEIPNLVMRRLYAERLLEMMLPSHEQYLGQEAAEALYQRGEMQPLCDFLEANQLKIFDNRDYTCPEKFRTTSQGAEMGQNFSGGLYHGANELTIKSLFLALLYNDMAYIMDSEPALERTYAAW